MVYRFKDCKLDVEQLKLEKAGQRVHLEPQQRELLLLLIQNRQRVLSKEEILATVWRDRVVTDNAMSRSVYELRKALGDDSDQQSIIRTVRGHGYQFVADIEESSPAGSGSALAPALPRSKTAARAMLVVFALLAISFVYLVSKIPGKDQLSDQSTVTDATAANPIIGILPVDIRSDDADLGILAISISDYLNIALSSDSRVKVITPNEVASVISPVDDLKTIRDKLDANNLIQTKLENSPGSDKAKLTLSLGQFSPNKKMKTYPLGEYTISFPESPAALIEFNKLRGAIVDEIVQLVTPAITIKTSGAPETVQPEAYRLALNAFKIQRENYCDGGRSGELLQQAIELDENFAYAWVLLSNNYLNRVWACGESSDMLELALEAANRADSLAPGKYRAVHSSRHTILIEQGKIEESFGYDINPDWDDPAAIYRAQYTLRYAGFLKPAERYLNRLLELDPLAFSGKINGRIPNTLLYLNQIERYAGMLPQSTTAYVSFYHGLAQYLLGRPEEARPHLEHAFKNYPNDVFSRLSQAMLAVIDADMDTARVTILQLASQRRRQNNTDAEITYKQAQLLALAGNHEAALENLAQAVAQGFFNVQYLISDPLTETLRDKPQFEATLAAATQRHLAFAKHFDLEPEIPIP